MYIIHLLTDVLTFTKDVVLSSKPFQGKQLDL